MFAIVVCILGLAGALACVVGAAVFILWARDNAPLLFMAAMFVVFGCVAYWGGHAFASLETGSFTTLPATVDVSTLDPIDRVRTHPVRAAGTKAGLVARLVPPQGVWLSVSAALFELAAGTARAEVVAPGLGAS